MKIVVIDGQGGKLGKSLVEAIKKSDIDGTVLAIGTNSIATSAMLKAGADEGATGENPVIVACRDADLIIGPIGILSADSLLGEITPAMAVAIGSSQAKKFLIPMNKCDNRVIGVRSYSIADLVKETIEEIKNL
ncbi:MAG: DUF3842 family protein [Lachnospiraceae bacterium]|nr:DUF3842 family protein [Lachnospiraceae bacterium]